jgi:hypothetical protein
MKQTTKIICSIAILVMVIPSLLKAQTLNARFSTSVYSWQNQYADSSSATSFRGYQTAMINVSDFGNRFGVSNLSFNTYVQTWNDFSTKTSRDPNYRVYNMYVRWRNSDDTPNRWDVHLGRQQILTGLRSPVVDGARVDFAHSADYSVMGFFGALAPVDGTISLPIKPYERRAFGAKVSTSKFYGFNTSLTYYDRKSDATEYFSRDMFGRDSLVVPVVKERLAGFDLQRTFMKDLNWYGHAQYDFLMKNLQRASTDFQYTATKDIFVAAQYIFRRPQLTYNSIFSAMDDLKSNQEIWFRGRYRISPMWSVNAEYANVFYFYKDAWRYGVGVTFWRTGLSYNRRMGYGGTMDMVTLSAYCPVTPKVRLNGSLSYTRFKLADDITPDLVKLFAASYTTLNNTNTSLTAVGRINFDLMKSFNVDLEGQYLSQDFKSYPLLGSSKTDVRLFVRANYSIFQKL